MTNKLNNVNMNYLYVNLGSGTQRIISPSPSDPRLSIHTIYAGRSGRKAWIKLDGMRNITGKKILNIVN